MNYIQVDYRVLFNNVANDLLYLLFAFNLKIFDKSFFMTKFNVILIIVILYKK